MNLFKKALILPLTFFLCFFVATFQSVNKVQAVSIMNPLIIMVGNSPEEINHQTGLTKADIIYEMNVEFPFTRLMAVFLKNQSTNVGPVRSSRYYFSRIAAEWSPIFAHCGGQVLRNERLINMDQMKYTYPYWRDKEIGGWINLFVETGKIREEAKKMGISKKVELKNTFLNFGKISQKGGGFSKIAIKYNQNYLVSFQYDSNNNDYQRLINEKIYKDAKTKKVLNISNIIVQYVPVEKIPEDNEGRLKINVIGEGIAKVFYGGHYVLAKWIKESKDHRTLFYRDNGELLQLNEGQTWIEIVPEETEVYVK